MSWQDIASELERFLVRPDHYDRAPKDAWAVHQQNAFEGVPSAMAHHAEYGWCVVSTSGQGPCVDFIQFPPDGLK